MKNLYRTGMAVLFFLGSFMAGAAHLVGGEMSYKCLGNSLYEVTLIIYRDCNSTGAAFDTEVPISVYNQFNQLIENEKVPLLSVSLLPLKAPNNCTFLPPNICTEKGIYIDTFYLPPIAGGYTISHQRCCRNNTITNVNNINSAWGSTYTTSIPSMDQSCNSSPKFSADPPVVLCLNSSVSLDLSATESDGDSLYYELCSVLHGGGNFQGAIAPDPAAPPPYNTVPFIPGYSVNYPIASSPPFSINPVTGVLTGKPNLVGQFVFAICVSEYRNGVYLSTNRRDFQFNVSPNCQTTQSIIQNQFANPVNICSNGYVRFKNLSKNATTFFWDFGDTTTLGDTSRSKDPTFFYQDTGQYLVTLIAQPGTDCADTSQQVFEIYDSTQVAFEYTGDHCLNTNFMNFKTRGVYTPNATFSWNFGGNTNIGQIYNGADPSGVSWNVPGTYYVTVTVTDFNCSDTYGDSIDIFPNPVIDEVVTETHECLPYTVQFFDDTYAYGPVKHFWWFGDGETSDLPNPVHTYLKPGVFTVQHAIKTTRSCLDSGYSVYPNIIEIFPKPHSKLSISPKEQLIYNPSFRIINESSGHTYSETVLPDGRTIDDLTDISLVLSDTGKFPITHFVYNDYGCSDTLVDTVSVEGPFNIFVPNTFTPNGDETNDLFEFSITGTSAAINFMIYNRWGEIIYTSTSAYDKWNGRKFNTGEILPSGVYSYVLKVSVNDGGYDYTKRGIINLLR